MEDAVVPGRYRHWKGAQYDLVGIGRHADTGESLALYRSCDTGGWWVRSLADFAAVVGHSGVHPVRRFERIGDADKAR